MKQQKNEAKICHKQIEIMYYLKKFNRETTISSLFYTITWIDYNPIDLERVSQEL